MTSNDTNETDSKIVSPLQVGDAVECRDEPHMWRGTVAAVMRHDRSRGRADLVAVDWQENGSFSAHRGLRGVATLRRR